MAVDANNTPVPDSETSPNDAGLASCPFCGGNAIFIQKRGKHAVQCENRDLGEGCPVNMRTHYTGIKRVAASLWNTRTSKAVTP